ELAALLDVLARHRKFVQFIPAATGRQMRRDVQRMADLTGPRGVVSNWDGGMSWFALENSWHKMVQAPRPEKEPMLRDPQWRALAREEWDRVPRTMIPHKHADRIRLVSVTRPENERWVG